MTEDRVRVLRIIEYEGPRSWVEKTLELAVHGTRIVSPQTGARVTVATLGTFPEIVAAAREEIVNEDQS